MCGLMDYFYWYYLVPGRILIFKTLYRTPHKPYNVLTTLYRLHLCIDLFYLMSRIFFPSFLFCLLFFYFHLFPLISCVWNQSPTASHLMKVQNQTLTLWPCKATHKNTRENLNRPEQVISTVTWLTNISRIWVESWLEPYISSLFFSVLYDCSKTR